MDIRKKTNKDPMACRGWVPS